MNPNPEKFERLPYFAVNSKIVRSKSEPLDSFSNINPFVRTDQEYLPPPIIDDPEMLQNFVARQIIDSDDEV